MMVGKGINDINLDMPSDAHDTGKDMPTFSAYLIAIVKDSTGKVIKVHKQRSHSPTANLIGLLLPLTWFNNANIAYTITNVTGGTCPYRPNLTNCNPSITYPTTTSSYAQPTYLAMIWVGTGSQSNAYSAYKLAAPITNGTGAGQLVYGAVSPPGGIYVSGSSAYLYLSQTFSNESGAAINITEVGIVIQLCLQSPYNSSCSSSCQVLVWYDVLSSPISVPNQGSVTIYYTFTANP